MATKTFQLSEIFRFLPKSHRKAGDGLGAGLYPFFTSSQLQTKWLNEADYSAEALILGTGGAPSIHCADNFSTSADTFIIAPKDKNVLAKYVYYFLSGNRDILDRGFKGAGLKHLSKEYTEKIQLPFPVDKNGNPDLAEQKRIVATLEEAESLKKKRTEADQKTDDLIPALFVKMFGDLSKYPTKNLGDFCQVTTGNTPSRAKDEFYGSAIEWIKTDNFFEDRLYPSQAKEGLSDIGAKIARIVSENSILMTCIAGSIKSIGNVCLTNRRVAFNQQINALTINLDPA